MGDNNTEGVRIKRAGLARADADVREVQRRLDATAGSTHHGSSTRPKHQLSRSIDRNSMSVSLIDQ